MVKSLKDFKNNRLNNLHKTFSNDVKFINGTLFHTKDNGIVEEYPQNPPAHKYLYGCVICGSYFETDIRQDENVMI